MKIKKRKVLIPLKEYRKLMEAEVRLEILKAMVESDTVYAGAPVKAILGLKTSEGACQNDREQDVIGNIFK